MSDTPNDQPETSTSAEGQNADSPGEQPASSGGADSGAASASSAASPASGGAGAVDTGRRIDPAMLQRNEPRQTLRRNDARPGEGRPQGSRPAPPQSQIEVPEDAVGAVGVVRVVEQNRSEQGAGRPRGPVLDAAAIAERAARNEHGDDRAPREGGGQGSGEGREARAPGRDDRGGPDGRGGGRGPGGPGGGRGPGGPGGGRGPGGPGGPGGRPRGDAGARGGRRDDKPRGPNSGGHGPGPDLFKDLQPIVVKTDEDVGDFAAMLAEAGGVERTNVRIGDRVKLTVVHIGTDSVFFELSKTQQAHAPIADYLDQRPSKEGASKESGKEGGAVTVHVGQQVTAYVVGFKDGVMVSPKIGKDQIDVDMLEQAKSSHMPVDGTVTGVNKGGYEISIGNTRGFCPLGQIDINFVDDPQTLVGKTLQFHVREVKEGGKNIVLSRRSLLERERHEKAAVLREKLAIGLVLDGVVTRIQPFGAFVDLGGIDGLVPVSELTYGRVTDPNEVVKVGEQVKVEIVRIEDDPKRPGQQRIGLSMKAMQQDPLVERMNELSPGASLVGRITRLEPFGAFVELFPGVEGLVHVSEISDRRIRHPADVLQPDEHVQVRIKDVDLARRRVSLSMREAISDQPQDAYSADGNGNGNGQPRQQQTFPPPKPKLGRGTRVVGVVDRIEKYGVFLNCFPEGTDAASTSSAEQLGSALMPASETGTPRGADLAKAFPIGSTVQALIIDIDERGRMKASKTAREQAEERALVDEYKKDKGQQGKSGLGSFGDLLKSKLGQ